MSLEALKAFVNNQNLKEESQNSPECMKDKILTSYIERDKQLWEYHKKQADNIRKSEDFRVKIYKGVQEGQDIFSLLLDAIQCISLMTNDKVFYEQNAKKLRERKY